MKSKLHIHASSVGRKIADDQELRKHPVISKLEVIAPDMIRQDLSYIFEHRRHWRQPQPDEYYIRFTEHLVDDPAEESLPPETPPVISRTTVFGNAAWTSLLLARRQLPYLQLADSHQLLPSQTIIRRTNVKHLQFVYAYHADNILIVPAYGGIMAFCFGVFMVDLSSATDVLFLNMRGGVNSQPDPQLTAIIERLISDAPRWGPPSGDVATVTGAMINNYGHTVLNHCTALSVLTDGEIAGCIGKIFIGDDDFLGFSTLLADTNRVSPLFDHFDSSIGAYVVPGTVLPVITRLPVRSSLEAIVAAALNGAAPQRQERELGVVITLDIRSGRRRCKNIEDLLNEAIRRIQTLAPLFTLILDGHTAKGRLEGADFANDDSHAFDLAAIKTILVNGGHGDVKIANMDGMTLAEKIRFCNRYRIAFCIAPLGSSLMFPIYFLNVPTIGYGESRMMELMRKAWAWHVDPGCHSKRILPLDIIPPSEEDADGFEADLATMKAFVDAYLSKSASAD